MTPETERDGGFEIPKLESDGRELAAVEAVSSIDGRYRRTVEALSPYLSEKALMSARIEIEATYLVALSEEPGVGPRSFTPPELEATKSLIDLSSAEANTIKKIEVAGYEDIPATNHDVKAIEYFMKEKLKGTSLEDSLEWVHWGLTSEDVNNLSYALMLRRATEEVMLPAAEEGAEDSLRVLAGEHQELPMLARTHGQPATPTTFGKEFLVYAERIETQLEQLRTRPIRVKLSGASGNLNAHYAAYPEHDWDDFSERFIRSFNHRPGGIPFEANRLTTQIEPHDTYAEMFDNYRRLNTILIDFNQDIWRYISDGWVIQKPVEGEVGSSTMPHKVNPIDFENSEGNLGVANALFEHLSRKLPISRLQRDLSDSTVERTFGLAFAHSLVGYKSIEKGLGKISVDEGKVRTVLNDHPEVITEAIQTILRREGVGGAYEIIKDETRGRAPTLDELHALVDKLPVSDEVKAELKQITPENYLGNAAD